MRAQFNITASLILGQPYNRGAGIVTRSPFSTENIPLTLTSSGGDGLTFTWDVDKTIGPTPDTARIVIYNLAKTVRLQLHTLMGLPLPVEVILMLGWESIPETVVFTGQIWKLIPERLEDPDVLTLIEAGCGWPAIRDAPPGGGTEAALGAELILSVLTAQLGMVVSAAALAKVTAESAKVPITKLFNFTGDENPREALDLLMASIGLSWGNDNGFFVVYQNGLRDDLPATFLAPQSGLLKWEQQDDGAVEFEALSNPLVVPGAQVHLATTRGELIGGGPLRIERVSFSGSTDGPSLMNALARKVKVI